MIATLPQIARAAVDCERHTALPAALSVAQCAIESGWLKHAVGLNCFGIKARPNYPRQLLDTTEWFTDAERDRFLAQGDSRTAVLKHSDIPPNAANRREYAVKDWFAAYTDLAACFADHAVLITTGRRYRDAWTKYVTTSDIEQLVRDIAPIYATDPNYAGSVTQIMRQSDVQAAIQTARNDFQPEAA